MSAELTYFCGAHFAHIAAFEEHRRMARLAELNERALRSHRIGRAR